MKKLLILMVGGFISFAAMAKPTTNTKTFEEALFWSCTVTRTATVTANDLDCSFQPIIATATATATATAETCGLANAQAYLEALVSAGAQVHGLVATIREPCDTPPPPTED